MKIRELKLNNFMIFNELDLKMSPNINVICGENSTGKTALLKIMYALMKGYVNAYATKGEVTKDKLENCLVNKMQGVFRPDKDAILFWDEPETNMNPKMIKPLVDAVIELAKMGVQVFITTHDYFVQQCFNLAATYQNADKKKIQYNFLSLYRDDKTIAYEVADTLLQLEHNAIMEEFDALYDREQGLIYGN